jgi:outer membrane biosynthesis protein TonB
MSRSRALLFLCLILFLVLALIECGTGVPSNNKAMNNTKSPARAPAGTANASEVYNPNDEQNEESIDTVDDAEEESAAGEVGAAPAPPPAPKSDPKPAPKPAPKSDPKPAPAPTPHPALPPASICLPRFLSVESKLNDGFSVKFIPDHEDKKTCSPAAEFVIQYSIDELFSLERYIIEAEFKRFEKKELTYSSVEYLIPNTAYFIRLAGVGKIDEKDMRSDWIMTNFTTAEDKNVNPAAYHFDLKSTEDNLIISEISAKVSELLKIDAQRLQKVALQGNILSLEILPPSKPTDRLSSLQAAELFRLVLVSNDLPVTDSLDPAIVCPKELQIFSLKDKIKVYHSCEANGKSDNQWNEISCEDREAAKKLCKPQVNHWSAKASPAPLKDHAGLANQNIKFSFILDAAEPSKPCTPAQKYRVEWSVQEDFKDPLLIVAHIATVMSNEIEFTSLDTSLLNGVAYYVRLAGMDTLSNSKPDYIKPAEEKSFNLAVENSTEQLFGYRFVRVECGNATENKLKSSIWNELDIEEEQVSVKANGKNAFDIEIRPSSGNSILEAAETIRLYLVAGANSDGDHDDEIFPEITLNNKYLKKLKAASLGVNVVTLFNCDDNKYDSTPCEQRIAKSSQEEAEEEEEAQKPEKPQASEKEQQKAEAPAPAPVPAPSPAAVPSPAPAPSKRRPSPSDDSDNNGFLSSLVANPLTLALVCAVIIGIVVYFYIFRGSNLSPANLINYSTVENKEPTTATDIEANTSINSTNNDNNSNNYSTGSNTIVDSSNPLLQWSDVDPVGAVGLFELTLQSLGIPKYGMSKYTTALKDNYLSQISQLKQLDSNDWKRLQLPLVIEEAIRSNVNLRNELLQGKNSNSDSNKSKPKSAGLSLKSQPKKSTHSNNNNNNTKSNSATKTKAKLSVDPLVSPAAAAEGTGAEQATNEWELDLDDIEADQPPAKQSNQSRGSTNLNHQKNSKSPLASAAIESDREENAWSDF